MPIKRKDTLPIFEQRVQPIWNNRKTLHQPQSSTLKWRFSCSSRQSFLNILKPCARLRNLQSLTKNDDADYNDIDGDEDKFFSVVSIQGYIFVFLSIGERSNITKESEVFDLNKEQQQR